MEAALNTGGDVITIDRWKEELRRVVSYSFSPVEITSPTSSYLISTSHALRLAVSNIIKWACSRIDSPLAVEALMHASRCAHYVVVAYDISSGIDIPCCFTSAVNTHEMRQVCFCDVLPNGVIERSKFYAMDRNCIKLLHSFHQLGHITQHIVDRVRWIISTRDNWNDLIDEGVADDLRMSMNYCMLSLHHFIKHPPCAIRAALVNAAATTSS